MIRKKSLWLVFMLSFCLIACGKRDSTNEQAKQENNMQMETAETPTENQETAQTEPQNAGNDTLIQGSTDELIYEVEYEEKIYEAEDGTAIFEAKLAYPVLIGESENIERINSFFRRWKEEKLREYETDDDSTWRSALEVYRESRDFGWMGPWSEEYMVTSVNAQNGYVSVLLDSYLYEGGNHGMPYRESFLFRKSDGDRVSLMYESGLGEEEWERMLEAKFRELVRDAEEMKFYSDADEILDDVDWDEVGSYFGDTGIVFYLPPYEIGPYSSGYAEVTASYEEIFGTY